MRMTIHRQAVANERASPTRSPPARPRFSGTGAALPERLREGIEAASGFAMADVRVFRDSPEPAKLGALAFASGAEIHLGRGQERHLPHEAWHVVQQKQGRVRGEAATNAGPANADAALEAEAERMANVVLRIPAAPRPAHDAPVEAPVVQAKVNSGGVALTEADAVSPTLLEFIRSSRSYQLRDDFRDRLMDEPVHLLDMSKKYLLGEVHGAEANKRWDDEVRHWSSIDKMFESTKALPDADRGFVDLPYDGDDQDLALESRHAYLLAEVMAAINELNVLSASWVRSLWSDPFVREVVVRASEELAEADYSHKEYDEYAKAYEQKARPSSRAGKVYAFAAEFVDVYHPAIDELESLLNGAKEALDAHSASDPAKDAEAKANFEAALDEIEAKRGFLRPMAVALIALNNSRRRERRLLESLLAPTDKGKGSEILEAVDPARERGMVANVSAAAPPLLVKLGDDHVDDVARMVGRSRVVAIRWGESLEDQTRRP